MPQQPNKKIYNTIDNLITILIPTYNEEQYIERCIESVLKFKLPNKCKTEIFIIDGGSTDQTVNQIKKYKYNNLELLHNEKKIQSAAINIGIKNSNGN